MDYSLSMALYATGNYDAAYFAGMIADVKRMTPDDFNLWMETAYFYMLSDYVVAVTLAESAFAKEVADAYIRSGKELYMSCGWSCYCWLLGVREDAWFEKERLKEQLYLVRDSIHIQPPWAQHAMNEFVITLGISYLPLHEEAKAVAEQLGTLSLNAVGCKPQMALKAIQKAEEKGRLGFKRRAVRC